MLRLTLAGRQAARSGRAAGCHFWASAGAWLQLPGQQLRNRRSAALQSDPTAKVTVNYPAEQGDLGLRCWVGRQPDVSHDASIQGCMCGSAVSGSWPVASLASLASRSGASSEWASINGIWTLYVPAQRRYVPRKARQPPGSQFSNLPALPCQPASHVHHT